MNVEQNYIVFEDLQVAGYKNPDRKIGLTYEHLEIVLIKLAKYHAATAVICAEDPDIAKDFNLKTIDHQPDSFHPVFLAPLRACARLSQDWPGYERFHEILTRLDSTWIRKAIEQYSCNEDDFNVVNHGDLWSSNLMYNFDESESLNDAILLDFQISFYGCPAMDLSYLLYTSSADDVQEKEWDQLLMLYHRELVSSLEKFEYPKRLPTLSDIHKGMLTKGFLGCLFSFLLVGVRQVEDTANADLAHLMNDDDEANEFREMMFTHPKFVARIQYLLDFYERKGYLEPLRE